MRPPLSLKRLFLLVVTLGGLVCWAAWIYFQDSGDDGQTYRTPILQSPLQNPLRSFCPVGRSRHKSDEENDLAWRQSDQPTRGTRALLIYETSYSNAFKAVTELLSASRIKYKSVVAGKNLPDLIKISKGVGKYGVIIFEDFRSYLDMDDWNRDLLIKYCRTFQVGILSLVPPEKGLAGATKDQVLRFKSNNTELPLKLSTGVPLANFSVGPESSLLRITRGGQTEAGQLKGSLQWVTFIGDHHAYEPVAWAETLRGESKKVLVMQDLGPLDSVPKVFIGAQMSHFIVKLLFLDSLSWLSGGKIAIPLKRYILVDVDDVFVGKNRFLPSDVDALIESQERLQQRVPGFKYNLGFSGGYYLHGATDEENAGDYAIMKHKDKFWWFPHMWRHFQPHTFNDTKDLISDMNDNKAFAKEMGLPVDNAYAVAPHHSGVYPVHEPLYEAWKQVWGIQVTSTEEYPHLRPALFRRGFVYSDISVLPRQTCGLFTKNLFYDEYPGGPSVLESSIRGGELFETILYNHVSIFMTHMPNYVLDRLAPYTFESVVEMVQCWTNLELRTKEPKQLAEIYFEMFPQEKTPIWGNPCEDRRHKEIWPHTKSCSRLPDLLVIGPQKTGTTALYKFLQMHPSIESNYPSKETFEELQFFSGQKYLKGIDWYMNFFPPRNNMTSLFEKSATYFDQEFAPERAHRLLPKVQLVMLIISPSKRAYSWYQHMKAKGDPAAMTYSFHAVVTAGPDAPKPIRQLQSRCLDPGKYSLHLERWLKHFNAQQLLIIDGEELKYDPVAVMNNLQHFLDVKPFFDYSNRLRFDKRKGFYCEVLPNNSTKCLGRGKGRLYPRMQQQTHQFLKIFFRPYNEALGKMLKKLGYQVPDWLEEDLKE